MARHFRPFPTLPVYICSRSGEFAWHRVPPLDFSGDPAVAFRRLKLVLADMKGTTIVEATDGYLHAVCRSLLGFVDDVECQLCAEVMV